VVFQPVYQCSMVSGAVPPRLVIEGIAWHFQACTIGLVWIVGTESWDHAVCARNSQPASVPAPPTPPPTVDL